jgi:hypothetical protein
VAKRRPKDIGTEGETHTVNLAKLNGFPFADRRVLKGSNDQGDVLFSPGFIAEVKAGDKARNASDQQITRWLEETERERVNANADLAVLVVARWRKPTDRWWAVATSDRLEIPGPVVQVRMYLGDFLTYARHLGYGTPLEGAA